MADTIAKDSQDSDTATLDEQINEALANTDDKGKLSFADDVDPLFQRAVMAEKKVRDTQASFTKGQQEIAKLRATNEVLENKVVENTGLTAEQTEELEDLKYSDPDKWFELKNKYENETKAKSLDGIKQVTEEASTKALSELTLKQRSASLAEFQERTGIELTDEVMSNDIPPRLFKKIDTMPFEQYLAEVAKYLGKDKVIDAGDPTGKQTDITKLAGGYKAKHKDEDIGDGIL